MTQQDERAYSNLIREIAMYERRAQKIEADPDPSKLRSNAKFYRLLKYQRQRELDAFRAGNPTAYCLACEDVLAAMGVLAMSVTELADRSTDMAATYYEVSRNAGYSYTVCDRFQMWNGIVIGGYMPKPSIVVGVRTCDVERSMLATAAHHWGIPYYIVDVQRTAYDLMPLHYIVEQLKDLIAFVEKSVPGAKFDEEKLGDILDKIEHMEDCYHDVHELSKTIPAPISGRDAFRIPRMARAAITPGGIEYYEMFRDEVRERVKNGIAAVPGEKGRLLWTVTSAYFTDLFSIVEKRGVSVPLYLFGSVPTVRKVKRKWERLEYGRKLRPLERAAQKISSDSWLGPAERWIRDVLDLANDITADGVVYYQLSGCPTNLNLAKAVGDRVRQELDVPFLELDGTMLDREKYDAAKTETALTTFVDQCLANKAQKVKVAV